MSTSGRYQRITTAIPSTGHPYEKSFKVLEGRGQLLYGGGENTPDEHKKPVVVNLQPGAVVSIPQDIPYTINPAFRQALVIAN